MNRVAIPLDNGVLSSHFGHAEVFQFFDLDADAVIGVEQQTPPPHEPGSIPRWLKDQGACCIIAGGVGQRAVDLFETMGIKVISGVNESDPDRIITLYLSGKLSSSGTVCSHEH